MDEYLDAISRESDRVAELISKSDLERSVPTCPDCVLRNLLLLGREHERQRRYGALEWQALSPSSGEHLEKWAEPTNTTTEVDDTAPGEFGEHRTKHRPFGCAVQSAYLAIEPHVASQKVRIVVDVPGSHSVQQPT